MSDESSPIRGRGAASNPANRFEPLHLERDADWDPDRDDAPKTQFYKDDSSSVITYNSSPDVGFDASLNPYRGCEHGCVYCYARPTHEYLGLSAGLDFESRIMVKEKAPQLLRAELTSRKWRPQTIALSGVTDPYQPVEKRLGLTRQCLEVLAELRNPVTVITKNHLVTRDIDHLSTLAGDQAAAVFVTITSLDSKLINRLEPRTSQPRRRLEAIQQLSQAGIPTGVLVAPVIPGLTEPEIPDILKQAGAAGARFAGYVVLRLPHGLSDLFEEWLGHHFPEKRDRVWQRLRALRGGKANDPRFGSRMKGEGIFADQIAQLFEVSVRQAGLNRHASSLSTDAFRKTGTSEQLTLFD